MQCIVGFVRWVCLGDTWWRHQIENCSALLALCAGNHRSPVNSPHKGQWRGALMFSLIRTWINGWVNNREAGFLGLNVLEYIYIHIYMYKDPRHEDNTVARWSYVNSVNSSVKKITLACWNNILRSTDASTILDDVTGVPWDRHYHERSINIYHTYTIDQWAFPEALTLVEPWDFWILSTILKNVLRSAKNVFKNVKNHRRGALMFSLISAWLEGWINNREAGHLRRHRAHYDVTVMSLRKVLILTSFAYPSPTNLQWWHMGVNVFQITGISTFCSTDCSGNNKRNIKAPHYWPLSGNPPFTGSKKG